MASTMDQRMGAFDAVMWNVEHDPVLRSVIVAVLVLDTEPQIDVAIDRIERMTLVVPELRKRVVGNPVSMVPPRWEVDPNFDLMYHLHWVAAPRKRRSLRAAMELAQRMAEQDFDRKRPLWEMALMTGLPHGQAALIVKIHHAITDGMGGLALASALLDLEREPSTELGPQPTAPTGSVLALPQRLADGARFEARRVAGSSAAAVTGLGGLARRTISDPRGAAGGAAAFLGSAGRLLAPASEPKSPIMTGRSLSSHFDSFECDFADLRAAAKAAGATINDVFMTVVARGLHRYHVRHGVSVSGLRFNMPINLRTGDETGQAGNRWVPARMVLPVDVPDPAEHLRAIAPLLRQAVTEPALILSDQVYRMLVRLPTATATSVSAGLMKGTDVAATNLPGPPVPVYAAGAKVLALLPFAPRGGAALNVALLTYDGRAQFAVNIDERAIPDSDGLLEDLTTAMDEVLALGAT